VRRANRTRAPCSLGCCCVAAASQPSRQPTQPRRRVAFLGAAQQTKKMATLQQEWVASPAPINCIALGSTIIATGGQERRCCVWRLKDGEHLQSFAASTSSITCLDLDHDETHVLSGCEGGSARVYDLREGKASRGLTGHRNQVNCCRFHPYGEFVATGGADSTVKVWDARKKACLQTYKGHGGEVDAVCFSPDGRWLASASRGDGQIRVWDLTAGKLLKGFGASRRAQAVFAKTLVFSPTELVLAASCSDRTARLYDLEQWKELGATHPSSVEAHAVRECAFSSSGRSLVVAAENGLRQWNVSNVKPISRDIEGSLNGVCAMRCGDDCTIACRRDGVVRIHNASLAYEDDFEDDVSDGAEAKASPVDEEPPAKAVDAKASPSVVFAPAQRRGLAPRNTSNKDRRRLSTSDLEDVKRRAAQPSKDGASVDDAITEILMGRKAKHELEARLEQLERASQQWGAGHGEEAFRALSGRNFSWEAVGDFLERVDATDLTLDAASTLAECAERWLKACCAAESDRAGEVCVLVVDACESALDAHGPAIAAASGAPALGVDLSREDRIRRCAEAQQRFRAVAAACAGVAFFGDAAARASKFAARCGELFP
jgi:katanin p80 WD40 repeat-containing subunit B1